MYHIILYYIIPSTSGWFPTPTSSRCQFYPHLRLRRGMSPFRRLQPLLAAQPLGAGGTATRGRRRTALPPGWRRGQCQHWGRQREAPVGCRGSQGPTFEGPRWWWWWSQLLLLLLYYYYIIGCKCCYHLKWNDAGDVSMLPSSPRGEPRPGGRKASGMVTFQPQKPEILQHCLAKTIKDPKNHKKRTRMDHLPIISYMFFGTSP